MRYCIINDLKSPDVKNELIIISGTQIKKHFRCLYLIDAFYIISYTFRY